MFEVSYLPLTRLLQATPKAFAGRRARFRFGSMLAALDKRIQM